MEKEKQEALAARLIQITEMSGVELNNSIISGKVANRKTAGKA